MQREAMLQTEQLHNQAMDYADQADAARRRGDTITMLQFFQKAFEAERMAAELLTAELDMEPTRSIIFRSAASLALDCEEYREAERLICQGLAGNPPEEIAVELRDQYERVNFQRHLDVRGVTLAPTDIQLVLAGDDVDYGAILGDPFLRRITSTEKLVYRIAERTEGQPYQEKKAPGRTLLNQFSFYLSVPRAASFAITLRLGGVQQTLPGIDNREQVVEELFDCLDLYRKRDEEALQRLIPDEAYYNNFVGLARQLEPDGASISTVGFTTKLRGEERRVSLSMWDSAEGKQKRVALAGQKAQGPRAPVITSVIGTLLYADATKPSAAKVRLINKDQETTVISVPEGMMSDVVGQYWDKPVKITGRMKSKVLFLEDIEALGETDTSIE